MRYHPGVALERLQKILARAGAEHARKLHEARLNLKIDEARLARAKELGADYVLNLEKQDAAAAVKELTEGYGADVVLGHRLHRVGQGVARRDLLEVRGRDVHVALARAPLEEIGALYRARHGAALRHSFASSSVLARQIEQQVLGWLRPLEIAKPGCTVYSCASPARSSR